MATGLGPTAANNALDNEIVNDFPWIKLHTGDPGSAGTNNAATNTTRKQATFAAAASGATTTTADLEWTSVPASEDYTHFTAWSTEPGGTFGYSGTVTADPVTTGNDFTIAAGDLDVSFTLAS